MDVSRCRPNSEPVQQREPWPTELLSVCRQLGAHAESPIYSPLLACQNLSKQIPDNGRQSLQALWENLDGRGSRKRRQRGPQGQLLCQRGLEQETGCVSAWKTLRN